MAKVNKKDEAKKEVELFSKEKRELIERINCTEDMISLTDLWKESGGVESRAPKHWLGNDQTKGFISALSKFHKVTENYLLKIKRGKGGGTYAHKQIALEYAQYLDERLGILVNEIFFQRIEEEKNPDLIVDRAIDTYKRKGKSDDWISKRLKGKARRNEFTSCLQNHGVKNEGFRNCTNAIYTPFYGGTTAVIREKKNLSKGASIRDNMDETELLAIEFAEHLSRQTIEKENLRGNGQCELACTRSSKIIASALMQHNKRL